MYTTPWHYLAYFWNICNLYALFYFVGVVRNPRGKKINTSEQDNLPGQDMDAESEERQNLERKCNILESVMYVPI